MVVEGLGGVESVAGMVPSVLYSEGRKPFSPVIFAVLAETPCTLESAAARREALSSAFFSLVAAGEYLMVGCGFALSGLYRRTAVTWPKAWEAAQKSNKEKKVFF